MHAEVDQERARKWLVAAGLLALTLAMATVGRSVEPPEQFADPVRIVFPDVETDRGLIFRASNDY